MSCITTVISTAPTAAAATQRRQRQPQRRPPARKTSSSAGKTAAAARRPAAAATGAVGALRLSPNEPLSTRELRHRIFPTLYAIFQQSRGQEQELKIKNRSLRSLTRSCLYHKSEDQLRRTLEDAEALFSKYCALTLKD